MIAITKSVLRQPATSGLFMADSDRGASLSLAMGLYLEEACDFSSEEYCG